MPTIEEIFATRNSYERLKKYTVKELVAMRKKIQDDAASQNKEFLKYSHKAWKRMEIIDWAITYHLKEDK